MNWDTRIRLDESPGNCAKWKKKPVPKGYILYDYNYITTSKCQNYRNVEQISDCQEWGEGGGEEERVSAKGGSLSRILRLNHVDASPPAVVLDRLCEMLPWRETG